MCQTVITFFYGNCSLEHQLMRQQEELKERTSEQLSDESEQSGGEDKAKGICVKF